MDHPNGMYAAVALVALSRSYVTVEITLALLHTANRASNMVANVNKRRITIQMPAHVAS